MDARQPAVGGGGAESAVANGAGGVRVSHGRGVGGAVRWEITGACGSPLLDVRADDDRLTLEDLEDLAAVVERIAARRRLTLLR